MRLSYSTAPRAACPGKSIAQCEYRCYLLALSRGFQGSFRRCAVITPGSTASRQLLFFGARHQTLVLERAQRRVDAAVEQQEPCDFTGPQDERGTVALTLAREQLKQHGLR